MIFHPVKRLVRRSELIGTQSERGKKLVVQSRVLLIFGVVDTGYIQSVTIVPATVKIFRKCQPVLGHPSATLELALGQNHSDTLDWVRNAPHICNRCDCRFSAESMKVHLMHHTLDIRHTDLKRGVDMMTAVESVNCGGKFGRYNPLTVKQRDLDIALFLDSLIVANIADTCRVFHGNDINVGIYGGGIINNDN